MTADPTLRERHPLADHTGHCFAAIVTDDGLRFPAACDVALAIQEAERFRQALDAALGIIAAADGRIDDLEKERNAANEDAERLADIVDRLEHMSPPDEPESCPECGRGPTVPHQGHCDIGNALAAHRARVATEGT